MKPLEKPLRNLLEKTVREARATAESAARIALEQLGTMESAPFPHLNSEERELRRRLRAHGRQLGDSLNGDKVQTKDRLVEEVAYEHWHRMLFARFLAENNLLMYPDQGHSVPITLEECKDLAIKEGTKSGWELAGKFAARMLPQIFRSESPVFQVSLPPEYEQRLERLIDSLPIDVFTASDSLGWVYQFWQAKKKDEVNASEIRIGADELPAVTQLFTEPYMVNFLLDNSLGAWWASHRLTSNDYKITSTEEELRQKASIPGVPLEFLRFRRDEENIWSLTSDSYKNWPEQIEKIRILDPCCGSGHFLVAAFQMLVAMRIQSERISVESAIDKVLLENLYGLEIDSRCVEIAVFALALSAWRYPGSIGYRPLPELNIACSGLAVSTKKEDWLSLADKNSKLRYVLETLFEQFKDASILGSLINPKIGLGKSGLVDIEWDEISPLLEKALSGKYDDVQTEIGVVAQGLAKAAHLLACKYHLVVTNVPYLSIRKQVDALQQYLKSHYYAGRNDLATVFLSRCLELCCEGGTCSIVLPQNWLFLSSYKDYRIGLLRNDKFHVIARLGPGAFETISGEVVKAILLVISRKDPRMTESDIISGIDVIDSKSVQGKVAGLINNSVIQMVQTRQLQNPDAMILLENIESTHKLLQDYAKPVEGAKTIDIERFRLFFWEIPAMTLNWNLHNSSPTGEADYTGLHYISVNRDPNGPMAQLVAKYESLGKKVVGWLCGKPVWGKSGVSVAWMQDLPSSLYAGSVYDNSAVVLYAENDDLLPAIYCYVKSKKYSADVRKINQKMQVATTTLGKVRFDISAWSKNAEELYPNGLPKPYTNDPTQWVFHGHPCGDVHWDHETKSTVQGNNRFDYTALHVSIIRLLGYRWPSELDDKLNLCMEARLLTKKCDNLLNYADRDGIVCIPSVRGELNAADRLEALLAVSYGQEWSSKKRFDLLSEVGYGGKSLETWLRNGFFEQHCRLFHDRPFIWQIWDGLNDGFSVLVNYHKLTPKLLETLIYTYLGDWISRQKQESLQKIDGAEEKIAAAQLLKKRLELILEGDKPYDIFVRWKPIEQQPIGWNPDSNDGIRLNIRPFMSPPDIRKKGAGILRDKPNISWDKDRGVDLQFAPWFKLGIEYGGHEGDRINNHHLSLADKKAARSESSK